VATELSELESARLKLVRDARAADPELARALHQVTRVAAGTLGVERCGVWAIEDDWRKLRCILLYDVRTEQYASGQVLQLSQFPAYAVALKERRVITAEDALNDPRTRELKDSYLGPLGITGMMDCPVYEHGDVVAIVCHERTGPSVPWTKRDQDFAGSVADIVGLVMTQVAGLRFEAELRTAREELAQARVMDSLGRMAAGVAHDFNNVLSGIALAVQVLDSAVPADSSAHEAAVDVQELVSRGARLVKQLLTFARQGAYAGVPVEVSGWMREMLPRLGRSLGPDVVLKTDIECGIAYVGLDAPVFEQILVNLMLNARDAMPGGGQLEIRCWRNEGRLKLSVRDNGLGMDAATRQQIFEPFFTTKRQSGTGLGLAIVFGAVRSVGGTISVETEPGRGSTFTLDLPLVPENPG
jgi:two-component system, cell cycle sensor histidine kinase and response regulator CckA